MMKTLKSWLVILGVAGFGAGSEAAGKPILERGWIGAEFAAVPSGTFGREKPGVVYVREVFSGTPSAEAGLLAGDVVVSWAGGKVRSVSKLREFIDASKPGHAAEVEVWRAGKKLTLPVVVGRETFQKGYDLRLGLRASQKLDVWPDPEVSLLPVFEFRRPRDRVELKSGAGLLARHSALRAGSNDKGLRSEEGWNVWLGIVGLGGHKRVLSQESWKGAASF